jgi:hypothetical protein
MPVAFVERTAGCSGSWWRCSRGWLYYNKTQVGTFRSIFNPAGEGNHKPTVLIRGTPDPIRDAPSAIQFNPPNGGHRDYRPGHDDGGVGPLALQVHNSGTQDEYRGLYVESPVVTKPGEFLTL